MTNDIQDLDLAWFLQPVADDPSQAEAQLELREPSPSDREPPTWLESPPLEARSDAEVLGMLLAGSHAAERRDEADRLLRRLAGLSGLIRMEEQTLRTLGLSSSDATRVAAASELACRFSRLEVPSVHPTKNRGALVRYIALRYRDTDQNVLGVLFLDKSGRLLAMREIFRGAPHRCSLEPAPVLREALVLKAAQLVIFMVRMGRSPEPIEADRLAARLFEAGCAATGLTLLDLLVITGLESWASILTGTVEKPQPLPFCRI